jgi:hypothetical protein
LIEVPKRDNGRVFPKDKEDVLFAIEDDDPHRNTKMMMALIRNNETIDQFITPEDVLKTDVLKELVEGELKPENNLNSDLPSISLESVVNKELDVNKDLPPMPQEFHDMIKEGLSQFSPEEFMDFLVRNTISGRNIEDPNEVSDTSSINTMGNNSDSTGTTYGSNYNENFIPFITTGTFIKPIFTNIKYILLKR